MIIINKKSVIVFVLFQLLYKYNIILNVNDLFHYLITYLKKNRYINSKLLSYDNSIFSMPPQCLSCWQNTTQHVIHKTRRQSSTMRLASLDGEIWFVRQEDEVVVSIHTHTHTPSQPCQHNIPSNYSTHRSFFEDGFGKNQFMFQAQGKYLALH